MSCFTQSVPFSWEVYGHYVQLESSDGMYPMTPAVHEGIHSHVSTLHYSIILTMSTGVIRSIGPDDMCAYFARPLG